MRKVLIAMLALSTLAWAHGAKKTDQTRSGAGNDWYQATLDRSVNHSVKLNQTVSPASSATAESASFQAPGSMAAPQRGEDFYNQKIKIQSDANVKEMNALKGAL